MTTFSWSVKSKNFAAVAQKSAVKSKKKRRSSMGQQEIKQGLEGITPNQEFAVGDWGTPEPAVPKKKKVCCLYLY